MSAIALALFIFTMLQSILSAMKIQFTHGAGETRLGVIEKYAGPRRQLPESYWNQLEKFEGVTAVTPTSFTVVSAGKTDVYYVAILVDPETYRKVFESMASNIPADQYENFIKQKNGAIVGEKIMQKYGWHVGDIVNLGDLQNNITLNLIISGVYKEPPGGTDQMDTRLLVNRDYYDSLIENPGLVSVFWLRLDKPTSTLPVIQAVTDYYSIGPMPVSVETESSMLARLTSYTATIQLVIRVISTVVLFTILLVTINTIALSMRERRKEIAIMKALGYKPSNIIGIVIGEAVVTSLAGSIIGTLLAYTLFNLHTLTISLGLTFDFIIQPQVVITGILLSLLIGILSGVIPAYNASRINVIKVLHSL